MSYVINEIDHLPLTNKINEARITAPLNIASPVSQSHGFRASSLSGCMRKIGYAVLGYEPTHDTYNVNYQLQADMGTAIHTRIQEQFVASGLCTPSAIEVTVEQDEITGHIDSVIALHGVDMLLDLKTTSSAYFSAGHARWLAKKLQGYAVQVHFYLTAVGRQWGPLDGYIYLINRDDPSVRRLYHIPYQPDRWGKDVVRVRTAQRAVADGRLPTAEPGACRFCSFRGHCPGNTYRGAP